MDAVVAILSPLSRRFAVDWVLAVAVVHFLTSAASQDPTKHQYRDSTNGLLQLTLWW